MAPIQTENLVSVRLFHITRKISLTVQSGCLYNYTSLSARGAFYSRRAFLLQWLVQQPPFSAVSCYNHIVGISNGVLYADFESCAQAVYAFYKKIIVCLECMHHSVMV